MPGVVNWAAVIHVLYQYLHLLHSTGPLRWVHDELAQLARLEYGAYLLLGLAPPPSRLASSSSSS